MLPLHAAEAFKEELGAYLQPDGHGDERGYYALSSLYYDSPGYRSYWEKVEGLRKYCWSLEAAARVPRGPAYGVRYMVA